MLSGYLKLRNAKGLSSDIKLTLRLAILMKVAGFLGGEHGVPR